jgi:hypothetical protein
MAADISNELLTYRPLSQLIPSLVVQSIRERVAKGSLSETDLPLEIKRLQILWNPTTGPMVQLNDEVQINVVGLPAREGFKLGDPIYASDIVPGSERLVPPTVDGKPVAYYLCFSSFMDLSIYFDFTPNAPGGATEPLTSPPYQLQSLAIRNKLIAERPPQDLLARLKQLGWPPSPTYYPTLAQTVASPGGDSADAVASTIIGLHGADYWERRIALWEELRIFSTRMPYVRKAIEEYLKTDYVSAIYVAVPQFEGIINEYVRTANGAVDSRFRTALGEFEQVIESRKMLLFPRFTLKLVIEYIDSGSFWDKTSTIANPKQDINRHGIAHGVFTGFESQELALKFLILLDCLAFILLQDQLIRGLL